jgi:probable F420-dependent oxidoreductase
MLEPRYASFPVRVGVQIQPQDCSYSDIRVAAAALEELGVDVLFNWDHFHSMYGPSDRGTYECWTMLGAWAEATSRVQFGPLVSCASYRNPDLLAYMARTVDSISPGRLVLGLGAGWYEPDYRSFGYEFGTPADRADGLQYTVSRVEARWRALGPATGWRIPILIGGNGPNRTLRIAARHADIWHGFGDAEKLAQSHRILDERCAEEGRDPGEIERSARVFRRGPDEVGDGMLAAGTRLIQLVAQAPHFDPGPVRDWLAFRDEANIARSGLAVDGVAP